MKFNLGTNNNSWESMSIALAVKYVVVCVYCTHVTIGACTRIEMGRYIDSNNISQAGY